MECSAPALLATQGRGTDDGRNVGAFGSEGGAEACPQGTCNQMILSKSHRPRGAQKGPAVPKLSCRSLVGGYSGR